MDELKILNNDMSPIPGSFSLDEPNFNWYKCREEFSNRFEASTTGFFFGHKPEAIYFEKIVKFIEKTENVLSLVNDIKNRTTFKKTTRPWAIWLEPSSFWTCQLVRRSLFTILLRASFFYDPKKDNYDEALFQEKYLQQTKLAVCRFMFGYTNLKNAEQMTGGSNGWYAHFNSADKQTVINCLVPPAEAKIKKNILGLNSIWN